MIRILRYLADKETNCTGKAWVLVTRVMEDLDFTREEAYRHIMKANDEGLVKIIKTLEPGSYGLLSVTITDARAVRYESS